MNKTDLLFYADPYARAFSARVLACEGAGDKWHIVLDKTVFYPEGGGQPGDIGDIGGIDIFDTKIHGGIVTHIAAVPLEIGAEVAGNIDFDRRYRFMQNHAGEHIISGIAKARYGANNVGFGLMESGMRIDFDIEMDDAALAEIEAECARAIELDLPIDARFFDNADHLDYRSKKEISGDIRIVSIPNFDICACAGMHVRTTLEIGIVKIISSQRYKGGTRIIALCGKDAADDYANKHGQIAKISALLSAKPEECAAAAAKMAQDLAAARFRQGQLLRQIFDLKTASIPENTPHACIFEPNLTPAEMQLLANQATTRAQTALIFSESADKIQYLLQTQTDTDLRPLSAALNAQFTGRGGGKPQSPQGLLQTTLDPLKIFLPTLLDNPHIIC